ncbi:tetratricopeptide repeat protein [Spirochaetia bacterium 38H-sp]|uniref:Tetratricopeptide repeat protein n=1 Tax=Rarispira pelagica TaxID=3141764 RepID=A0ABU9UAP5_9SPIR
MINKHEKNELESLWNDSDYWKIIDKTEELLINDPLNTLYINFNAISYLAVAFSVPDNSTSQLYISKAVLRIRKFLFLENDANLRIYFYYLLGKAYFLKGDSYLDLSEKYLLYAYNKKYESADIEQYLGLLYSKKKKYQDSNLFLEKAYSKLPSDMIKLAISKNYFYMGDFNKALNSVDTVLTNNNKEAAIYWDALLLKGEILYENKEYDNAKKIFDILIANNKHNALAYYFVGEIAFASGNKIEARALWRKALKYDSDNHDIISRLKETDGGF